MTLFETDDAEDSSSAQPTNAPTRRRTIGTIFLAAAFSAVVILGVSPAPYVIEQPGPVFNTLGNDQVVGQKKPADAKRLITIPDATTYPTAGSLDLLTVRAIGNPRDLPNWLQVVGSWFRPSEAAIPVDVAFSPSVSVEQQNEQNQQLMVDSQKDAVAAALNQLGYVFPQEIQVLQVMKGTPADGTVKVGDKITSLNGTAVRSIDALRKATEENGTKKSATVGLIRDGKAMTVGVTPIANDGSVIVGVGVRMKYSFPITVNIELDNVGGPSAGQMFALGIIDKLTPGKLNGGERVAGTGTIDNDGNIGPIGGIRQKMFGAKDAGATWFLAPAGNCDEVSGHVPSGITVFAVKNLEDSLKVLDALRDKAGVNALPTCSSK